MSSAPRLICRPSSVGRRAAGASVTTARWRTYCNRSRTSAIWTCSACVSEPTRTCSIVSAPLFPCFNLNFPRPESASMTLSTSYSLPFQFMVSEGPVFGDGVATCVVLRLKVRIPVDLSTRSGLMVSVSAQRSGQFAGPQVQHGISEATMPGARKTPRARCRSRIPTSPSRSRGPTARPWSRATRQWWRSRVRSSRCPSGNAGTLDGIKSSACMKKPTSILYSRDTKMNGKNCARWMDKMFHNH